MKKIICFLAIIFLLPSSVAFCATITLKWDASTGATGYKIDQSTNNGTTWTEVKDAGNVLTTTVTAPDTGLILYRVKAYNANVPSGVVRTNAGAWYNGTWTQPTAPTGTGIQ